VKVRTTDRAILNVVIVSGDDKCLWNISWRFVWKKNYSISKIRMLN